VRASLIFPKSNFASRLPHKPTPRVKSDAHEIPRYSRGIRKRFRSACAMTFSETYYPLLDKELFKFRFPLRSKRASAEVILQALGIVEDNATTRRTRNDNE